MLATIDIVAGAPLPTEFRLFTLGENPTSQGVFTLTAESAAACVAAFARDGVRYMVDLNHDSLNEEACAVRADASDARGWFSVELRADGLYATQVDWTPDGERRLREKTQAYISPAFLNDENGVVWEIINAALCARPSTYNAPALVAASKRSPLVQAALTRSKRSPRVLVALARAKRVLATR